MAKDIIQRLRFQYQDTDLRKAQKGVKDLQGQMGNLNNIVGQLGGSLGGMTGKLSGVTSMLQSCGGGYMALAAAAAAATAAFVQYNVELEKNDQLVQTITGTTGAAAEQISNSVTAMASVYGTDIKQNIGAVNTLMHQFGLSGKQATDIVRDGLQGMTEGNQGNFLSMLQQYAPAFRDMGVSASELAAIIQNTEGGIFGPEGLQSIQMAGKKIREMSTTTQNSLKAIGIDADEMKNKLQDGSLSMIDAIKQIASKMGELDPQSQELGKVMQDVFGRQGAQAGQQMLASIANLNTNLDETKRQTGSLGQSLADLERSQETLNAALRECFGMDGFAVMGNDIKTKLNNALTNTIRMIQTVRDTIDKVKSAFDGMGKVGEVAFKALEMHARNLLGILGPMWDKLSQTPDAAPKTAEDFAGQGITKADGSIMSLDEWKQKAKADRAAKTGDGGGGGGKTTPTKTDFTIEKFDTPKAIPLTFDITESLASLKAQLQQFKTDLDNATTTDAANIAQHGIDSIKAQIEAQPLALRMGIGTEEAADIMTQVQSFRDQIQADFDANPITFKVNADPKPIAEASKVALTAEQNAAGAAKAFGAIGNALSQIEDPGAKVMGIIAEAIANIAASFAASLKGTATPWDWIAAAVAGTATMVSTIAAIKAATADSYAEGGWVGGSSGGYVGDAVPAFLNRGEYVMTQSDVETANSNLEAAYSGGGGGRSTISGEQIVTVVNAYGRRTGRGEILR